MPEPTTEIENLTESPLTPADKSANRFSQVEQAEKNGKFKPLTISELPEKAQKIALDFLRKAEAETTKVLDIKSKADTNLEVYQARKDELQHIKESLDQPSSEEKAQADTKLAAINQEFVLMKAAFAKLTRGEDAPELRETISTIFDEEQITEYFSPAEIEKYKRKAGIINGIRGTFSRLTHGNDESKMQFQQRVKELLYQRGIHLLSYVASDSHDCTDGEIENVNALNQTLQSLSDEEEPFDQAMGQHLNALKKASGNVVSDVYYFGQLWSWIQKNQEQIQNILGYTSKDETTRIMMNSEILGASEQINKSNSTAIRFIGLLKGKAIIEPYQAMAKRLLTALERISKQTMQVQKVAEHVFPEKGNTEGFGYAVIPKELIDIVDKAYSERMKLALTVEEFTNGHTSGTASFSFERFVAKNAERAISELAEGQNTLLHTGSTESVKQILRTGLLASRKTQIERFGKSSFYSSQMVVGKDYVEIAGQRMSKKEYDQKVAELSRVKTADQEEHLISFSKNQPYYYSEDVAMVFSQVQLFAKSQFTEADGWQLYDKNYNDQDPNSPGCSVDLTKEPMVLLVTNDARGEFEQFIKTEMVQRPEWKDVITDPDQWIQDHVVFLPPHPKLDGSKYAEPIRSELEQKLFGQHPNPKQIGKIIPTGEFGDTVGGKSALYTYSIST